MASYLDRLKKLEAEHAPTQRFRIFIRFVNMQREAVTLLAHRPWFHRADGASEDDFCQRARRSVGREY